MNRRNFLTGFLLAPLVRLVPQQPTITITPEQIEALCRPLQRSVMSNDILNDIFQVQYLPRGASIEYRV